MEKTEAELSLALVSDREIQELNRRYRGQDKPTDVLSFPLQEPVLSLRPRGPQPEGLSKDRLCPTLLGDVVISMDTARRQAEKQGIQLAEEVQALLIHGILHLLGYDHEVSRAEALRMRKKERELKALLAKGDLR